jgi:hypothetical protein
MDPQELIWAEVSIDARYALLYFGDAEKAEGDSWDQGKKLACIPYSEFITCVKLVEALNTATFFEHIYNTRPRAAYYVIQESKAPIITGPIELRFGESLEQVLAKLEQAPHFHVKNVNNYLAGDKVVGDTEDADELMAIFGK